MIKYPRKPLFVASSCRSLSSHNVMIVVRNKDYAKEDHRENKHARAIIQEKRIEKSLQNQSPVQRKRFISGGSAINRNQLDSHHQNQLLISLPTPTPAKRAATASCMQLFVNSSNYSRTHAYHTNDASATISATTSVSHIGNTTPQHIRFTIQYPQLIV